MALTKVYYFTVVLEASLLGQLSIFCTVFQPGALSSDIPAAERGLFTNCLPFGPRIPGGQGRPGSPLFAFPLSWNFCPVWLKKRHTNIQLL